MALRARESGCHIVCANAAPESGKLNAPTGIVGPDGRWIASCPRDGERVCHTDLDPE
jgi:predicted amidohydrolase